MRFTAFDGCKFTAEWTGNLRPCWLKRDGLLSRFCVYSLLATLDISPGESTASRQCSPRAILVAKSFFTLALRGIQAQNPPSGRAVQTRWQADLYGRVKCDLSWIDPHSRQIHIVLTRMMRTMSLMLDFATSIKSGHEAVYQTGVGVFMPVSLPHGRGQCLSVRPPGCRARRKSASHARRES
jgi:hypothetical protein